jgi:hypothetical protein
MQKHFTIAKSTRRDPAIDREMVAEQMAGLLHNPKTPTQLWEAIMQFVCDASNENDFIEKVIYTPEVLEKLVELTDDPMERRLAGREKEERHAK